MDVSIITPMVLTYNESANIERTMRRLSWASRVLVIDSGSTDGTLDFLKRLPQVQVVHRSFDSFAEQCNFGLQQIASEWVLSLDADYVLTEELIAELRSLPVSADVDGYKVGFRYCIEGRPLRASLYPARAVLYRREKARYHNDGHGHKVAIQGRVGDLKSKIDHDDRKSLSRWLASQDKYALLEAEKLSAADPAQLPLQDRLRLTGWAAVPASLVFTLLVKGTLWDGWRGWYYALQRMLAEMLLALRLIERKMKHD